MRTILVGAAALLLVTAAGAAPDGWSASLEDGLAAAKKSGKPVLVITLWKDGV